MDSFCPLIYPTVETNATGLGCRGSGLVQVGLAYITNRLWTAGDPITIEGAAKIVAPRCHGWQGDDKETTVGYPLVSSADLVVLIAV